MKLVLVNEVLPVEDFAVMLRLARYWVPVIQREQTGWDELFDCVTAVTHLDPAVPYVEKAGECPIYLTERNTHVGSAGRHYWNDALKIPYAYCSLKNSRSVFGKVHLPTIVPAHKIGKLFFPRRVFGTFSIRSMGLATVMLHEIFEIIGNPELKNGSGHVPGTSLDGQGRSIFMENTDPVERNYIRWIDPVTKQNVVVPNFVYRHWFNRSATGVQFDEMHLCHSPFVKAPGGRVFELRDSGATWLIP